MVGAIARKIELALPMELSSHSPKKKAEDEESYNPHVHIILTAKPLNEKGDEVLENQNASLVECMKIADMRMYEDKRAKKNGRRM